jgi:hypothetical protein
MIVSGTQEEVSNIMPFHKTISSIRTVREMHRRTQNAVHQTIPFFGRNVEP